MGFRLSSFVAGAAENLTSTLKEDERQAAAAATFGVKALKENYDKVQADNRKLETEVSENIKVLRTFDSNATEAQLFAAATNKTYMTMALEAAKANPATFKVGDVVKIKEENASPLTAMEMLKTYTNVPAVSKAARQTEDVIETEKKDEGLFGINTLRDRASNRAASKAEEQTAKAMGVPIEQLRAASGYVRPEISTGAQFDFTSMQPAKSYDKQEQDAKTKLLNATREGDPQKVNEAKADLLIFKTVKETLTPEQTQFSNKVADIKNRYMFGTPEERKAAKPEYDKLMADVRAEAMAKKTGEGAGEGKIPALSTLNTFTSASVARAVAAKHGDLIKSKQLAIVEKPDGSVGIDYIGDNDTLRRQILETQANAAKNALSLYTDAKGQPFNRDVASVLNSFTSVVPSVMRDSGDTTDQTKPAAPTSTTPAPKTKAEYDAIPKGIRYIDTDGKTKIKG